MSSSMTVALGPLDPESDVLPSDHHASRDQKYFLFLNKQVNGTMMSINNVINIISCSETDDIRHGRNG